MQNLPPGIGETFPFWHVFPVLEIEPDQFLVIGDGVQRGDIFQSGVNVVRSAVGVISTAGELANLAEQFSLMNGDDTQGFEIRSSGCLDVELALGRASQGRVP